MPTATDSRLLRCAHWIYALMLRAYPTTFRREYSREMMLAFEDRARDVAERAGGWAVLPFMLHITCDWLLTMVREGVNLPIRDPTGVVEVRCIEPLPHSFSHVKVSYSKTTKKVTISGSLMMAGKPRAATRVHIDAGPKATFDSLKPWAVATTGANGSFTIVKPLPKTLYAFVYVNAYFAIPCSTGPSSAPKGCAREDTSPAFGPALVLKPKN